MAPMNYNALPDDPNEAHYRQTQGNCDCPQCSDPTLEFNGEIFQVGDEVIYSVYPLVANGTGTVTATGIVSTGDTARDVTARGFGLDCPWEHLYDVKHVGA
jgi:hypothetical protein